jgi:Leucine-rich repeat (LRR) protein
VPLLDSITANWRTSIWRRSRPWIPWIGAAVLAVAAIGASTWRKDPIAELTDMGWAVEKTGQGLLRLSIDGPPPKGSGAALMRITYPLTIRLGELDESVSQWRDLNPTSLDLNLRNTVVSNLEPLKELKNLTSLDLSRAKVSNVDALKELKNLTFLGLASTGVSNVEPLKGLKNLTFLDLAPTQVRNVEPLKELKNLTVLYVPMDLVSEAAIIDLKKGNKNLEVNRWDIRNFPDDFQ